jgi:hypothetical protein
VSVNGTPVEAKLCTFTLESTHFIFNLCHTYTHDGASAKFSTNSQETDYSVVLVVCKNVSDTLGVNKAVLLAMCENAYDIVGVIRQRFCV